MTNGVMVVTRAMIMTRAAEMPTPVLNDVNIGGLGGGSDEDWYVTCETTEYLFQNIWTRTPIYKRHHVWTRVTRARTACVCNEGPATLVE